MGANEILAPQGELEQIDRLETRLDNSCLHNYSHGNEFQVKEIADRSI